MTYNYFIFFQLIFTGMTAISSKNWRSASGDFHKWQDSFLSPGAHTWWSGVNGHRAADQADKQTLLPVNQAGDCGLLWGEEMLQSNLLGSLAAPIYNYAKQKQTKKERVKSSFLYVKKKKKAPCSGTCPPPCPSRHWGHPWRWLGCRRRRSPGFARPERKPCRGSGTPR